MREDNAASAQLSDDERRAAMEQIVASETFSGSPQLVAFLRFVVEESLQGNADRIKAYSIGTKVLNRPDSFDPQIDPIVRVEATRLRRAIERYYAGIGAHDPVLLELPRGTYVPAFRRRGPSRQVFLLEPRPSANWGGLIRQRGLLIAVIVLLTAGITTFALVDRYSVPSHTTTVGSTAVQSAKSRIVIGALRPGNGMPNLSLHLFQVSGQPQPGSISPKVLFEKIQSAFSRFDLINIVTEPLLKNQQVDYRLFGFVEFHLDGTVSLQFQLLDVVHGILAWVESFDRLPLLKDSAITEDGIVKKMTPALLGAFGIIHAHDRALQLSTKEGDPRYRCILEATDAIRSFDAPAQKRARACLETLTATHPDFVAGFALLAQIYNREYLYGIGGPSGDTKSLDRALRIVRHAIELSPNSALARVILMNTFAARHDMAAAIAAGEKALAFNKYDPIVVGNNGYFLVLSGQVERGMALLRALPGNDEVRPAWFHFAQFLGSYLTGDLKEAERQANSLVREHYVFTHLSRALIARAKGDNAEARAALDRLAEIDPGWRTKRRSELQKFISDPAIVDRLNRDLTAADTLTIQ